MKSKKWIFLILAPFLVLSCGEDANESAAGFSLILPGQAPIIPSQTTSCNSLELNDLKRSYFRLRSATINWERENEELILSTLRVDVRNSALNSDFREIMDSTDIAELFVIESGATTTPIQNGIIPPNSRLVLRANCSLSFGGVSVPEDSRNFTAEAVFTLDGVAVGTLAGEGGNLGVESAVRTTQKIRLTYSIN